MVSFDVWLEQELKDAGQELSHPPNSVRLLPALDVLEKLLLKVAQAPKKSILDALKLSKNALIHNSLSKHSDIDVRVSVASCISEITRITAPDAPYTDDQMKDVFQLIVSSFEDLADQSSRSYRKRASILENVSKLRLFNIMLDLECDELIVKMFEHFLKSVRDYHPGFIYSSMESIMVSVIEESEEISVDMLKPLLASVKKHREGVFPIAHKLAKGVLLKSANKLKPYIIPALTSFGESLDMYHKVVAAVCEGTTADYDSNDDNDNNDAEIQLANECKLKTGSPKSVVSNGVIVTVKEKMTVDQASKKLEEDKRQEVIKKEDANGSDCDKLLKENSQTEKVFVNNIEKEVDTTIISVENGTGNKFEDNKASDSDAKPLKRSKSKSTKQSGEKSKQSDKKLETPVKKGEKSKIANEDYIESDGERLKLSARKNTSKKKDDGKKCADGKNVAEKDRATSLLGDDKMDVSPKIAVMEDDSDCKPLKLSSRKRTSKKKDDGKKGGNSKNVAGKAKTVTEEGNLKESPVSNAIKYDESLVGKKVKVWWPEDKMYYEGVVSEFYPDKKKHKVSYVADGDEEKLNLKTQKWELLEEFSVRDYTEQNTKEIAEDNNVEAATTEKDKDTQKTSGNLCDAAATTSKEVAKSRKSSKKTVNESKGKTPPGSSKSNTDGEKTEYDKEKLRLEDKRLKLEAEKLRIEAEKERSKIRQEDERLRLEGERLRLEAEKLKLSKKESDDRIMMMDVSVMPEMQRLYFENLQREIVMRCNHA